MRKLTLNDGTVYELDWCNERNGICHISVVTEQSFVELATKFSNKESTRSIEYEFDEAQKGVFSGYTELQSIRKDVMIPGTALIVLLRPVMVNAA